MRGVFVSRTPAIAPMTVVRGATWEDEFTYTDDNGVPVDLTGYEARLQVRTLDGQYGASTTDTLLMQLSTVGLAPQLFWSTAAGGRLLIHVAAADTAILNPANERKVTRVYGLEVYLPAGVDPEYVIPLVQGKLVVMGETVR